MALGIKYKLQWVLVAVQFSSNHSGDGDILPTSSHHPSMGRFICYSGDSATSAKSALRVQSPAILISQAEACLGQCNIKSIFIQFMGYVRKQLTLVLVHQAGEIQQTLHVLPSPRCLGFYPPYAFESFRFGIKSISLGNFS